MTKTNCKYWVGVASKDHVENGVRLGICQFCHGKPGPAKRLSQGDFLIYYSSKYSTERSDPYQKFTALGIVKDDLPYQVEIKNNFKPFRRNIEYLNAKHADIKPLIPLLPFIKNKSSWGVIFRYGFLEIDKKSFEIIAFHMLGYNPLSQ